MTFIFTRDLSVRMFCVIQNPIRSAMVYFCSWLSKLSL